MKIAFIGGGNMASALIGGLLRRGTSQAADILVIEPSDAARARLSADYAVSVSAMPNAAFDAVEAVVLAVKPDIIRSVAQTLAARCAGKLVISIAAGIRATDISRWLSGHPRVIRAMPNTPASIGLGVTGLAALGGLERLPAADRELAGSVLQAVGQIIWCRDESQIDAITAISGSGPAYVFYFIEALEEAARQLGFDEAASRTLAIATFTGATQLAAQSGEPAALLRERVTSKGGTTAAALATFTDRQVQQAIIDGAKAAQQRAIELGDAGGRD